MKNHEYIIENLTDSEIDKLQESAIEWYPDDLETSNENYRKRITR